MANDPDYLVRYGLMGRVGRFTLDPETDQEPERGHSVVVRTDRGLELGEVLARLAGSPSPGPENNEISNGGENRFPGRSPDPDRPGLLRAAGPEDLERARRSETLRHDQFAVCRRILAEGGWPLDLLDVEPLLDLSTTVLHVLGPHDLDLALLRARFRSLSDFDIVFESVGSESFLDQEAATGQAPSGPRRCGDCDCSEGGCGKAPGGTSASGQAARAKEPEPGSLSCDTAAHSACSSCGVSQWRAGKRNGAD
jgi:hypothetical protein